MIIYNSILNGELSKNIVIDTFNEVLKELLVDVNEKNKLSKLFNYALDNDITNDDFKLFKNIKDKKTDDTIYKKLKSYLIKWCNGYLNQIKSENLNVDLKTKGEIDPALKVRIKRYHSSLSDDNLSNYEKGHFLFMSAENHNGLLLEEYLAYVLEPLGWIWCAGEIYKAIDFIYFGKANNNDDVSLQVKNKYNTENSSSNKIRENTPILKWYRLKSAVAAHPNTPRSNWKDLIDQLLKLNIYNDFQISQLKQQLSEKAYLDYIENHTY